VKGHTITIGQIADFVASCNGKIVEILAQILHFLKKELSRWAEEMSFNISGTNNDTKMKLRTGVHNSKHPKSDIIPSLM
jgi:hypothetical protein